MEPFQPLFLLHWVHPFALCFWPVLTWKGRGDRGSGGVGGDGQWLLPGAPGYSPSSRSGAAAEGLSGPGRAAKSKGCPASERHGPLQAALTHLSPPTAFSQARRAQLRAGKGITPWTPSGFCPRGGSKLLASAVPTPPVTVGVPGKLTVQ